MTRPPILPGMRVLYDYGATWRVYQLGETLSCVTQDVCGLSPDYFDPATCGALMAWCHRELQRLVAETHKPLRPHLNAARVALNEARPWDAESVQRAVDETCKALDNPRSNPPPAARSVVE